MNAVEGKTINPGVGIHADGGQTEANQRRQKRLQRILRHHAAETGDGEHHQGKILGRTKRQRPLGQRRGEEDDAANGDQGAKERADGGNRERHAAASLLRHWIAIQRGHNGGGIAGHVKQNRGNTPPVFAADIDRRQQDQRRFRRQVQRKGQRQ